VAAHSSAPMSCNSSIVFAVLFSTRLFRSAPSMFDRIEVRRVGREVGEWDRCRYCGAMSQLLATDAPGHCRAGGEETTALRCDEVEHSTAQQHRGKSRECNCRSCMQLLDGQLAAHRTSERWDKQRVRTYLNSNYPSSRSRNPAAEGRCDSV
jgi:hypothetical protein